MGLFVSHGVSHERLFVSRLCAHLTLLCCNHSLSNVSERCQDGYCPRSLNARIVGALYQGLRVQCLALKYFIPFLRPLICITINIVLNVFESSLKKFYEFEI